MKSKKKASNLSNKLKPAVLLAKVTLLKCKAELEHKIVRDLIKKVDGLQASHDDMIDRFNTLIWLYCGMCVVVIGILVVALKHA
jgi:hypothetical protein